MRSTQICERLDGIPLAIELAAARARSLSVEELLERLRDRFRLLRGSGRSTLDRHHTLRATVSWSYQLLSADERLLFDRASVFAGGFDLRAAEVVCGFDPIDDDDVVDLVSSLVDKSMIVADRGAVGMRYRLLETLRQYGEDQLELRGETARLRDRHAAYHADLIAELDLLVRGPRQIEGETRMSIEWDNLRAAHLWSLAQGDLDLAERLAAASFEYSVFSMRHEHAAMVERTVQLGDERDRPSTTMLGMLSYWVDLQGNQDESRRLARRGIELAASPDDSATAICWLAFAGASAGGCRRFGRGADRLPTPGRSRRQHPRSRAQLVGIGVSDRCIAEHRSHGDVPVAAADERDRRPSAITPTDDVRPSVRGTRLPQSFPSRLRRCDYLLRTRRRDRPRHGRPALVRDRPTVPRHGIHRARRSRRTDTLPRRARLPRSRSAFGRRSGKPSSPSRLPWRGPAAPKRPP